MKWSIKDAQLYKYYCKYFRDYYPDLPQIAIEKHAAAMVEKLKATEKQ